MHGVLRCGSEVLAREGSAEEDAEYRDHGRTQSSRPGTTHTWHIVSVEKTLLVLLTIAGETGLIQSSFQRNIFLFFYYESI